MLFSDSVFIFRALPLFLLIYYIAPYKARTWVLFLTGILFYAVNAPAYTILLMIAIAVNYAFSSGISRGHRTPFICSTVFNVLILAGFKALSACDFTLILPDDTVLKAVLPLGISFYMFKLISYQTDLYRGNVKRAPFGDLGAYTSDFTQIISGPIGRFEHTLDNPNRITDSSERSLSRFKNALSHICDGLTYFIAGLFLKVMIADHLSILWKELGTIGYDSISTPLAWLGVLIYSLNLYYDFWGYSLMAAGLGVMVGFKFIRNFKNPYASSSVTDFYRRWHITLGEWFRDYVYIPLGGSRRGGARTALNLCIVWLLTGIWHGLTPNYLIWAGILLVLILWEKFVLSKNETLYHIFGHIHVWFVIPVTWIIFAMSDFSDLKNYLLRMAGFQLPSSVINASDYSRVWEEGWIYLVMGLICLFPGVRRSFNRHRFDVIWTIMLFIMFWFSIYSICGAVTNPFMYMSF